MHMLLVTYPILTAVLKWGPANGVVYTFAKMCVKSIFRIFLIKQVSLSNCYNFPMQWDQMRRAWIKRKKCIADQNSST